MIFICSEFVDSIKTGSNTVNHEIKYVSGLSNYITPDSGPLSGTTGNICI